MTAAPEKDQLGAAALACLYADWFAGTAPRGATAFATGASVDAEELAILLPVLALWSLQQDGHLSLQPYADKRLRMFTARGVRAVLLRAAGPGGLEGRLLRALAADRNAKGADVYRAVRDVVPRSRDPHRAVVAAVTEDLVTAGYLSRVAGPEGVWARVKGQPRWTLAAVPDRYPGLAARVDDLARAWHAFLTDPVYPATREAVRRAIASREESDSDGPDFEPGGAA